MRTTRRQRRLWKRWTYVFIVIAAGTGVVWLLVPSFGGGGPRPAGGDVVAIKGTMGGFSIDVIRAKAGRLSLLAAQPSALAGFGYLVLCCHEVKGENFPAPTEEGKVGPELSAMGPLHDPDYFAEALINPSAVIEQGKGFEAPDGSSKMPSFNDSMTVQELVDLVAFLRALKPPAGAPAGHGGH